MKINDFEQQGWECTFCEGELMYFVKTINGVKNTLEVRGSKVTLTLNNQGTAQQGPTYNELHIGYFNDIEGVTNFIENELPTTN